MGLSGGRVNDAGGRGSRYRAGDVIGQVEGGQQLTGKGQRVLVDGADLGQVQGFAEDLLEGGGCPVGG